MSASNCVSGGSQFFSQFCFHLSRCFKRHRVQMFIKLWHQSHAVFPDDPSRFVAVFVILESMIDRNSRHSNINAGLQQIAFGIKPQNRRMLCDRVLQQNHINIVVKVLFLSTRWFLRFQIVEQEKMRQVRSVRVFSERADRYSESSLRELGLSSVGTQALKFIPFSQ